MLPPSTDIAAILPQYTSAGDKTVILLTDGTAVSSSRRVKTIINNLARKHAVDLASLRRNAALAAGRSIYQPLAITPGLVLIPVKVRKPKIAGDPCTGYINCCSIRHAAKLTADPRYSEITLVNGMTLTVFWSLKTVTQCIHNAKRPSTGSALSALDYPTIHSIAYKLVEVFQEILSLKLRG